MKLSDVLRGTDANVLRTTVTGLSQGVAAPSQLAEEINGFSADSRQIARGDVFFALAGERVDGHDFVESAFEAGAAGVVVTENWLNEKAATGRFPPNRWILTGPSPLAALQQLAQYWRDKHDLTVVGVTGSVGKTTVKEMTAQVLSAFGKDTVLKTSGNLNTEIGLALELLKLNPQHRYAVLEMGMYQRGDIALLANIARPKLGIVTNVQANHLERTGSIEATAQAKAELVHALPPEGLAILNGDDRLVRFMCGSSRCPAMLFGLRKQLDLSGQNVCSQGRSGFKLSVRHGAKLVPVTCSVPGAHNAINILPAAAAAHHLGLSWEGIVDSLRVVSIPDRLSYLPGPLGSTILDDRYNASAPSVIAAIDLLMSEPGRKLALLGDMYELGAEEEAQHRLVGQHAAGLDYLILVGPRTRWIAEEALSAGLALERIVTAKDNEEAADAARSLLKTGDTLLVKGSRGLRLEEVVKALASLTGTTA